MRVNVESIINIIQNHNDFCIYTHIKPDGDAFGSSLSLAIALQNMGKRVCVKCQDPWPNVFLDIANEFVPDMVENEIGIAVDISSAIRLGVYQKENILICIDHHKSNLCDIKYTYLEEDAISCSSIIFRLLESINAPITPLIRKLLFIGLLTDSDGFKSPDVTNKTFRDAADMLCLDISPSEIIGKYYSCRTVTEIECEKTVLNNLEFHFNKAVTIAFLPKKMHERIGFGNTDFLASIPARIKGVELGITVFEKENGDYSVSIRSNGNWDASLLASALGGGGHKSAAGASITSCNKTELLDLIKQQVRGHYLLGSNGKRRD